MGVKTSNRPGARAMRMGLTSSARVVVLVAAAALLSDPALAEQAVPSQVVAGQAIEFHIPAQDLNGALLSFARAAGMQVFFDAEWVRGRTSATLDGKFTAEQGLVQMLAGTGLTWRFTAGNTVTLEKMPEVSDDAMIMAPVAVDAKISGPAQAEIGNLPPAYAGGQVARGGKLGILGNRDVMDTPFNQTSYTAETIENQQSRTVAHVLENDPSVRFTTPGGHAQENYKVRGFPVQANDLALNGMYGLAPNGHAGTEFVERVEVLKGPNALLNGIAPSGAVGGAINLVTKRAADRPVTEVTGDFTSGGQGGSHVDVGRRFGADGKLGVRVNGVYRDGDTGVDGQKKESRMAVIGADYRGDNLRLTLDAYADREAFEGGSPMNAQMTGTAVPSAPKSTTNFFRGIYGQQENNAVITRAEYDITRDVTAYAGIGVLYNTQNGFITSTHARNVTATGASTGSQTVNRRDFTDSVSAETGVRANFQTGDVGHQVVASYTQLDQDIGTINVMSSAFASNIYNPIAPPLARNPGEAYTSEINSFTSMALADTLSALDDRVQLTLGARNQRVHAKSFTSGGAESANYDKTALTPAVGLVIKPLPQLSLYGNYIEALTKGDRVGTTYTNAGHVFAPYVSKQKEAGIKWDAGKLANTLSVFQIDRHVLNTSGNTAVEGEQRNRGVEWNVFGELVDRVRVLGGVAYTEGVMTKSARGLLDGKTAFGTPKWQGNLGLEWDPPMLQGLTLEGRAVYTDAQYVNSANTLEIPEWWRLDLGMRYALAVHGNDVTLRGYVINVMGKDYWAGTFADGYVTISEPRTFMLSASVGF